MKKVYVVILAVVACVLAGDLIYMGTVFTNAGKKKTDTVSSVSVQDNGVSYSAQVSSEADTAQTAVQNSTSVSYEVSYAATSTSAVQQQTSTVVTSEAKTSYAVQDVIAAMQTAVNYAKSAKNFSGTKKVTPGNDTKLTDLPAILSTPANAILKNFLTERGGIYTFVNGVADDVGTEEAGDTVTANDAIQPKGRPFELHAEGISSYHVQQNGKQTTYIVTLIPEDASLASPQAYYHSMVMDCFDLSDYDISPAKVNSADIHYFGSTVTVTVNENGLPLVFSVVTPSSATGEGSLLGITASGTLSGTLTETWMFSF